ncbi:MAG: hypothetical protein J4N93_08460, partial [Chloroflexi bacterium]|nr:hypothetical protein [Chloroflexota bacterium]
MKTPAIAAIFLFTAAFLLVGCSSPRITPSPPATSFPVAVGSQLEVANASTLLPVIESSPPGTVVTKPIAPAETAPTPEGVTSVATGATETQVPAEPEFSGAGFRANPQRTGAYHTRGVDRLNGLKWKFVTQGGIVPENLRKY